MNAEDIVNKYWLKMFDEIVNSEIDTDDMYELLVEVKFASSGKTIRRSWREREEMLSE